MFEGRVALQVDLGSDSLLDLLLERAQKVMRVNVRLLLLRPVYFLGVVLLKVLDHGGFDVLLEVLPVLLVGLLVDQLADQLGFVVTELADEDLKTLHVDVAGVGDVVIHHLKALLVDPHQHIDTPLPDAQAGYVRQEVIPHEEAQEHEIVDHSL